MEDLGSPVAYTALAEGTPVHDRNGRRVGVVEHVLADTDVDIFHGLVIHTKPVPRRHLYADADQIAELHEGGVLLAVEEGDLPEPSASTTRRAWHWISNRR